MYTCSILRYPGGKFRALKKIFSIIPRDFKEFREPLVGGGSVFLTVKQNIRKKAKFRISDLNYDLCCFWWCLRDQNTELVSRIKEIWRVETDGRKLYKKLQSWEPADPLERAVRFFVLNRITFSGLTDSGGYSEEAFHKRFTSASIEKLRDFRLILKGVDIRHADYEELLLETGENVFIFLDPPYYSQAESRLYGVNGNLHTSFDHERFADAVKKCRHKWLITYDDSPEIRKLFDFAYIYEWELQYGMNNYKQQKAAKGKELFISNHRIPALETRQLCLADNFIIFS